jgi:hypothetical protein
MIDGVDIGDDATATIGDALAQQRIIEGHNLDALSAVDLQR